MDWIVGLVPRIVHDIGPTYFVQALSVNCWILICLLEHCPYDVIDAGTVQRHATIGQCIFTIGVFGIACICRTRFDVLGTYTSLVVDFASLCVASINATMCDEQCTLDSTLFVGFAKGKIQYMYRHFRSYSLCTCTPVCLDYCVCAYCRDALPIVVVFGSCVSTRSQTIVSIECFDSTYPVCGNSGAKGSPSLCFAATQRRILNRLVGIDYAVDMRISYIFVNTCFLTYIVILLA